MVTREACFVIKLISALCIWQELELYDYEKDTTQKTFLQTFTCSVVRNHSVCRVDFSPATIFILQQNSSLRLDVDFETSWASVSLGATAGVSCKGWMFLLANSSIINGNFQSLSSPTGILLLSAFLPLSSKCFARYLRSKPQGIEESHVDFHSAWHGRVYSKIVKKNFRMRF